MAVARRSRSASDCGAWAEPAPADEVLGVVSTVVSISPMCTARWTLVPPELLEAAGALLWFAVDALPPGAREVCTVGMAAAAAGRGRAMDGWAVTPWRGVHGRAGALGDGAVGAVIAATGEGSGMDVRPEPGTPGVGRWISMGRAGALTGADPGLARRWSGTTSAEAEAGETEAMAGEVIADGVAASPGASEEELLEGEPYRAGTGAGLDGAAEPADAPASGTVTLGCSGRAPIVGRVVVAADWRPGRDVGAEVLAGVVDVAADRWTDARGADAADAPWSCPAWLPLPPLAGERWATGRTGSDRAAGAPAGALAGAGEAPAARPSDEELLAVAPLPEASGRSPAATAAWRTSARDGASDPEAERWATASAGAALSGAPRPIRREAMGLVGTADTGLAEDEDEAGVAAGAGTEDAAAATGEGSGAPRPARAVEDVVASAQRPAGRAAVAPLTWAGAESGMDGAAP